MRHLFAATALCLSAAVWSGCAAAHTSFRTSFKSSFMKSCTAQAGASEQLCGCVEGMLERKNTDAQLLALTPDNAELLDSARACAAKKSSLTSTAVTRSVAARSEIDPAHIDAYVTPYYNPKGPRVSVGGFSSGLASGNETEVVATLEKMKREWRRLSFPQLYAGAIRLYDLGYRNEAAYWFYTAQYRGRQFSMLLDPTRVGTMGDPGFELRAANGAFMQTVGTWINGYAFGDTDGLIRIVRKVQKEGRTVSDLRATYPRVVFIQRRRWAAANTTLAAGMDSFVTYLEQKKDEIKRQRIENGTEAKFAGLTSKELPKP